MSFGELNIAWGWICMPLGIISGSILSMWSFDGPLKMPKGYEHYDNLPRRLIRLAHVALFMLPLINIVYGQHLDSVPLSDATKVMGSYCMIVLMIGTPLFLILASFKLWFKYLNIIPIISGFLGMGIMAWGQWSILSN